MKAMRSSSFFVSFGSSYGTSSMKQKPNFLCVTGQTVVTGSVGVGSY